MTPVAPSNQVGKVNAGLSGKHRLATRVGLLGEPNQLIQPKFPGPWEPSVSV